MSEVKALITKQQRRLEIPLFRTYKPSFFRGFNEEPQSRYNSNSIDDLQLVSQELWRTVYISIYEKVSTDSA